MVSGELNDMESMAAPLVDHVYEDMFSLGEMEGYDIHLVSFSLDESNATFGVRVGNNNDNDNNSTNATNMTMFTECDCMPTICMGRSVPTFGMTHLFAITCGQQSYVGTDQYHFSPTEPSKKEPTKNVTRAHACRGEEPHVRPEWKLLGFFKEGSCDVLQSASYDPDFCDNKELLSTDDANNNKCPSAFPSMVPSVTTVPSYEPSTSAIPSNMPSLNGSDVPTVNMSNVPSLNGSDVPTINMSNVPSLTNAPSATVTTNTTTNMPSLNASDVPTVNMSNVPSLTNVPSATVTTTTTTTINTNVPSVAVHNTQDSSNKPTYILTEENESTTTPTNQKTTSPPTLYFFFDNNFPLLPFELTDSPTTSTTANTALAVTSVSPSKSTKQKKTNSSTAVVSTSGPPTTDTVQPTIHPTNKPTTKQQQQVFPTTERPTIIRKKAKRRQKKEESNKVKPSPSVVVTTKAKRNQKKGLLTQQKDQTPNRFQLIEVINKAPKKGFKVRDKHMFIPK